MTKKAPRWGSMVFNADMDVVAGGVLISKWFLVEGYYHWTQALEKYLKALCLTIFDPDETKSMEEWVKFLMDRKMGHNLLNLARYCADTFPVYGDQEIMDDLARFSSFDQATRYPWVKNEPAEGFSGKDIAVFFELIRQLRNDLTIEKDDYPLGILLRGYHHGDPNKTISAPQFAIQRKAVLELKEFFPDLDSLAR